MSPPINATGLVVQLTLPRIEPIMDGAFEHKIQEFLVTQGYDMSRYVPVHVENQVGWVLEHSLLQQLGPLMARLNPLLHPGNRDAQRWADIVPTLSIGDLMRFAYTGESSVLAIDYAYLYAKYGRKKATITQTVLRLHKGAPLPVSQLLLIDEVVRAASKTLPLAFALRSYHSCI